AIDPTGAYLSYVVPGIILTCAGFGASGVAVSVNRDVTTGAINRFRTMPIAGATVLVGHVVASLLRNLVATGLVIGVGVALGFRPDATPLEWVGAVGVVGLYILAITALFAFIGLVAGSPESANGYGFLLLFLPYASSAFVPVETMPSWLRGFSEHQPITPVIETIRGLLTGTESGTAGPLALAWRVGVVLVAGLLVALTFPRRLRRCPARPGPGPVRAAGPGRRDRLDVAAEVGGPHRGVVRQLGPGARPHDLTGLEQI